ncbi:Phosphoinositide phospholipase C 2 [Camellia lanceoleosa]|uniref:Phosphoinositide phospholipase C 2 n=1 Tax=Camellia lanceoleosa TaxID=1840588 RepID=A0ACC0I023_9ERIC|nr:Phosphoinositide phospholipase C 2 [Camellia lanceoleosa]
MTVDHLHRFLIEVEGEDKATKEDAESIMESLNELKHLNIFHRKGLHLEAFFHYLFSDSNPPLSPSPKIQEVIRGTKDALSLAQRCGHDSMSMKEPASQGSALLADEETSFWKEEEKEETLVALNGVRITPYHSAIVLHMATDRCQLNRGPGGGFEWGSISVL